MTQPKALLVRIGTAAFIPLALACSLALAACQAQQPETGQDDGAALEKGAARGAAKIEIVEDRVFLGSDETLWTASLESNGSIGGFENLGEFKDRVRGIAALDDTVYVRTIGGIYRMDLDEEAADAELIVDGDASDDLWVTSESLFYLGEGTLSSATLSGSDETTLKEDVKDFVVAGGSIYTLDEDGALTRLGFDGTDETEIDPARDRHDDSVLIADGNDVYLISNEVLVCRNGEDTAEEVELDHEVEVPDRTVVSEGMILYESKSDRCYRHIDGEDDEELEPAYFRGKGYSRIHDGFLYCSILGDDVTVIDLDSFDHEEYAVVEGAKSTSSTQSKASSGSSGKQSASNSGGSSPSGSYNIADSMEINAGSDGDTVLTTHFALELNGDASHQKLWLVEQVNDTTMKFCHAPSRAAGFDGTVFTLKAYDWGDNGYAEIPNAHIAGTSSDKKYVIIMPTDVRYDPSNEAQAEEYNRLRVYAETIDENANPIDNPFIIIGE